ncbi:MAG: hypothetical protein Kow0080_31910 [Candidatus Promineifilaceae bacterium]
MNEFEEVTYSQDTKRKYLWMASMVILIFLAGFAGVKLWNLRQQAIAEAEMAERQRLAIAQIENEWGIRVTRVALIADGGLIDFRYQVTDPDKAIFMFDDVENIPKLIDDETQLEIGLNTVPHEHELLFGLTYFFLLRNVDNAVEPGEFITVKVGDIYLPHFRVES